MFGKGKNKFWAKKVTYKGMVFDSNQELERYLYLAHLQEQGEISGLRRQTKFVLIPKTKKIVAKQLKTKVKYVEQVVERESIYHDDFTYKEGDVYCVEEYKGAYTSKLADYILRKKLMINKIHTHNQKGRGQWIYREVIFYNKHKTIITDK